MIKEIDELNKKSSFSFADLVKIMKVLRSENGCPWDREQTHESIRKNFIEETYEVCEAIDKKDSELLCEELGDVLMQVVFHAALAAEEGAFTEDDVINGVCRKLIRRHPHVFGDATAETSAGVLKLWDAVKTKEKSEAGVSASMARVPRQLPALMRAQKLQSKAKKLGYDFANLTEAADKLSEEKAELFEAISKDSPTLREEVGDLIFSAVNVARLLDLDAEECLTASADKFQARITAIEEQAVAEGVDLKALSAEERDARWERVKE